MATPSLGFDNFYTSTLSAGITASDTTIYLNALPTATEGYLVIEPDSSTQREIIYYTSKGANFVTLPSAAAGRGVGATTAQSHSSGVTAQMNVVAEHFEALQDGTAISNTAITAAKIANIATNTTAISNPYKFSVYRAAAWTTSSSFALVQFDTENFDTNNNFDVTTNKGRYTAPVAGFYLFSACTGNSTATGIQSIAIYKGGVKLQQGINVNQGAASTLTSITALVQLAAGNYVEIYNLGGAGSTGYTGQDLCWFTGFLVSQT